GWGTRRLSTRALFAIFRRPPRAGVGLALGPAAGVVDLEIDDRERAGPLLAKLFPEGPPVGLEATWHLSSEVFGTLHALTGTAYLVESRDSNRVGRPG